MDEISRDLHEIFRDLDDILLKFNHKPKKFTQQQDCGLPFWNVENVFKLLHDVFKILDDILLKFEHKPKKFTHMNTNTSPSRGVENQRFSQTMSFRHQRASPPCSVG